MSNTTSFGYAIPTVRKVSALRQRMTDDMTVRNFAPNTQVSYLHQVNLFGLFNHSSGFFSQFEAIWSQQSNQGYSPDIPGDDFWQFNAFVGYRFFRRAAEVRLGILNITDQDYRLNPLNIYNELPRERTLAFRFRLNF